MQSLTPVVTPRPLAHSPSSTGRPGASSVASNNSSTADPTTSSSRVLPLSDAGVRLLSEQGSRSSSRSGRGSPCSGYSCTHSRSSAAPAVATGAIQPPSLPPPPPISTRWWALHLLVLLALGSYLLTDMVTLALELSHAHALYLTSVISAISLASLARRLQLSGGGGARVQAMAVVCAVLAIVAVIAPWAPLTTQRQTHERQGRWRHVAARLWRSTSSGSPWVPCSRRSGRDCVARVDVQACRLSGQLLAQCGRVASRCMYGSFAAAGACVERHSRRREMRASRPPRSPGSFGLRWL